jgi:uncharacterized protein YaiE (UPF0345 family)
MASLFFAANGAAPTTAALVAVTTGTAIKTLLQIATASTDKLKVVEWGISFDGSALATPIKCELIQTNVAASGLTAHVAAGVQPYNDAGSPASSVQLGTALTGYTATTEGSTTVSRYGDLQYVSPTGQYVKQWPLGREFEVPVSSFLRVRVTAAAAVNAYCYIIWEE